ncbi:DUF3304 domain-containing protein [Pseudomonas psychrophila]|uniref:DUF3304 domain-containing protein n=1 Tax=Pseudomonas psychrophila TaxID=122355 RepID=A0ABY0W2K9_9PSED|nr:DUF3304 domain-containing protein [Pseudomonas psychrophila]KAB0491394.1 DUF3304 domain-containing protein [Pseudomonas psychrophila]QIE34238.1 DUF3304 domain-containing protein [Pseudomonas psychrophila]WVI96335.1 DUF3304 domain-containing protein [Pseudomonas psychrophila]SDU70340.1 Protein of unknown function [Pseudomonas psychrophila]
MSEAVTRSLLVMFIAGIALLGCADSLPDRLGAPIEGYSHTSAAINRFSVNGNGGPNLAPYGYSGGQMCCATLPVKWHPGLTVVVEWEKDPDPYAYGRWSEPMFSDGWRKRMDEHDTHYTRHRAVVAVAPYEDLGLVNVHFLPCNQVAVSAGATYPGLPDYPFHYPQKMQEPATCPKP